jgi:hypothetical protein
MSGSDVSALNEQRESDMKLTIIAVDLAKDVLELAVADSRCQIVERH